jgi:hypothetical protein
VPARSRSADPRSDDRFHDLGSPLAVASGSQQADQEAEEHAARGRDQEDHREAEAARGNQGLGGAMQDDPLDRLPDVTHADRSQRTQGTHGQGQPDRVSPVILPEAAPDSQAQPRGGSDGGGAGGRSQRDQTGGGSASLSFAP